MGDHLTLQVAVIKVDAAYVLANVGEGLECLHQTHSRAHHMRGHFGLVAGYIGGH